MDKTGTNPATKLSIKRRIPEEIKSPPLSPKTMYLTVFDWVIIRKHYLFDEDRFAQSGRSMLRSAYYFIIVCGFIHVIIGCGGSNMVQSLTPTPTPASPGNAFIFTANSASDNISAFANTGSGTLIPVAGSPFTSPGKPSGIGATPDGRFLYVSSLNNSVVTGFAINSSTGVLTLLSCPLASSDIQPATITIAQSGSFLYTANLVGSVSGFSINITTGCLTLVSTTPVDKDPSRVGIGGFGIDRTGKFLYVATGASGINSFSIASDGTLTRLLSAGFDTGSGFIVGAQASPTTDVLVVTENTLSSVIHTLAIDTTTGVLTHKFQINDTGRGPSSVAFNPSLQQIYIANATSNNFMTTRVAADGTLNPSFQTVNTLGGPLNLAIDPAGKFLYVVNEANAITAYSANINSSNFNSVLFQSISTGSEPLGMAVVGHP
jgi:6-phosphogluconolactonase (cycloisomerase 2 family)